MKSLEKKKKFINFSKIKTSIIMAVGKVRKIKER